jgi:hypothetical protein
MAKRKKTVRKPQGERPPRAKLSAQECLKRMAAFANRKEGIIAAARQESKCIYLTCPNPPIKTFST